MNDAASSRSTANDPAHADIGVVCALNLEIAPFLEQCDRIRKYTGGDFKFRGGLTGRDYDIRVALVEAGMGQARAERAAQALIDAHTPAWIICAGFAGALQPHVEVGDLVIGNSLVNLAGEELTVDLRMAADQARGWHVGRILTVDQIVRTVAEKQKLAEKTGGLAVDMESLAVARRCAATHTRFLAVRGISDDLTEDLPAEALSVFGGTGTLRAGAIAGAVWKRPGSVKDMWRLRERAVAASQSLAEFLHFVMPKLHDAIE